MIHHKASHVNLVIISNNCVKMNETPTYTFATSYQRLTNEEVGR